MQQTNTKLWPRRNPLELVWMIALMTAVIVATDYVIFQTTRLHSPYTCPELCRCKKRSHGKITNVDCSSNGLTEIPQIPSSTVYLTLQNNSIQNISCKDFQFLENLKLLDLTGNKISYLNPCVFVSQLKNLELLKLSRNDIQMLDVGLFDNLRSLVELDLSHNLLEKIEDKIFSHLARLVTLDLSLNKIDILKPNAFRGLRSLKRLFLQNNELNSTFSYQSGIFRDLVRLEVLDIKANLVSDSILEPLTNLRELYIDTSTEQALGPGYANLTNLSLLNFSMVLWDTDNRYKFSSSCRMYNTSSDFFRNIKTNSDLVLILFNCGIHQLSGDTFQQLSTLIYLDLRLNFHTLDTFIANDTWTKSLLNSKIQILDMSYSFNEQSAYIIDDSVFKYLQNTNLTTLRLQGNSIASLYIPPQLSKLQYLDVSSNQIILADFYLNLYFFNITLYNIREFIARRQKPFPANRMSTVTSMIDNTKGTPTGSNQMYKGTPAGSKQIYNQFGDIRMGDSSRNYKDIIPTSSGQMATADQPSNHVFPNTVLPGATLELILPKDLRVLTYSSVQPMTVLVYIPIPHFKVVNNNVLRHVELVNIKLTGWDGPVENVPSLEYLDLSKNMCKNMSSYFFKHMTNLRTLLLQENELHMSLASDVDGGTFSTLSKLSTLDLSLNSLTDLPSKIFNKNNEMKMLNISNNQLTTFLPPLRHIYNLTILDLSKNLLSGLSDNTCDDLIRLKAMNRKFRVHLHGNRLTVSCQYFKFLWLLKEQPSIFYNAEDLQFTMASGNKIPYADMVTLVPQLAYNCLAEEGFVYVVVIFLVTSFSVIIFAVVYHNRWKLRYLFYVGQRRLHIGGRVITYSPHADVFVTYEEDEPHWCSLLQETFLPHLRQRNIKYIVGEIDFPGGDMMAHVTAAVTKTKKTIVLLTQDIFYNRHREFELNLAIIVEMDTRRRILIPVFMEEVDVSLYPAEIGVFLLNQVHRWVYYEDSVEFWRRLFVEIDNV